MTKDSPGITDIETRPRVEATLRFLAGVSPTYDGPCRLLDWKHAARDGMTVDFALALPGPLGGHAFRGMPAGKETGQRFYLMVSLPRQADGGDVPVVHHGESLLLRWSENDRTGMMVRMLLDDGPDGVHGRHPFFGFAIGRTTGEPLEVAAWGIGDDEEGAPPSRLRRRTPFHQLTEVQQSQILCRDPRFRAFLNEKIELLIPDADMRGSVLTLENSPEQFASAAVRAALRVSSRSVMNRDGSAASEAIARWRGLVARYEDWAWGIQRR